MSQIIDHICTEINFPFCKILTQTPPTYTSRIFSIKSFTISSISTLLLLLTTLLCTFRMINNVHSKFSSLGRKEMKCFFYIYSISVLLELVLVSNTIKIASIPLILTTLQLSFSSTALFCLFIGSIITLYMFKVFGHTITHILSVAYFLGITPIVYFILISKNVEFFVMLCGVNLGLVVIFMIFQFFMLKKLKTDIWAYGTLLIGFVFFLFSVVTMFFGSVFVAFLSDRYLDGLFFYHLFVFCAIIMMHKFWLSVCENEAECGVLKIDKNGKRTEVFIEDM